MCLEIWKLMKFIVSALIWLILLTTHLIAAESEKPLERAAYLQVVAASNIGPTSPKHLSQVYRDLKEKND